ncbi:MAG: hypothetical protein F4X65_13770 [Chloroflexi bacterium]|nr:hypothetical protein [Chloroflexota bacterium]
MKFPSLSSFRLSCTSGVMRVLAPAVLAVGAMAALVLTVANTQAAGPPPDLGSDFNLPFLLEQGRPAPVFTPRNPQAQPTPTPVAEATPEPALNAESPCGNGVVVPEDISNPGLLADCELLWAMRQGFSNADEKLNWNADTSILEWDGISGRSAGAGPWRVLAVDLGKATYIDFHDQHPWDFLDVDYQLEGSISLPADQISAGGFSQLLKLDLSGNKLTGPIPTRLARLDTLEHLDLADNGLSGEVPTVLGDLSDLVELSLGTNRLTGAIPRSLGSLGNLEVLALGNNHLSGAIPSQLGNLSNLEQLELAGNRLTGAIPASLGNLSNLKTLNFMHNRLTGAIPAPLGNLSNLKTLNLMHNRLTGAIPASLGNLSNLTLLWLGHNRFSGCIPDALGNVPTNDLDSLDSHFCSEPVPSEDRAALVALYNSTGKNEYLAQVGDWLTNRPLGEWYGVATDDEGRVTYLDLGGAELNGTIPAALGNLSKLEHLDLNTNGTLTGSIPASLGNLSNLEYLDLSYNELTGPLPPSLGNLSKLEFWRLTSNKLTGPIPSSLGNLSKLERLELPVNRLTGSIPASLGNLSSLKVLLLDSNELTGTIPAAMGKLDNLETIRLSQNSLSGCIPDGLRDVPDNDYKFLWTHFCGE